MTAPVLEVRNLRTYIESRSGTLRAVDGVDLSVAAGQTLCLVGESGCGKSLTALSVMGLIEDPVRIMPGSEVRLNGQELTTVSRKELERLRGSQLAMIFQDPMSSLNPLFSVGGQIAEQIRRHQGTRRKAAWERAVELLALVGVPSPAQRVHDYPHQLSGGMRQRVMIAMALSCDPKLLIADEPTTALDVTIQAQILALLGDLQARLNMAILLITHDFGVVADIADDVAVMYAGQIVERGPAAKLLAGPQHPYAEGLLRSVPVLGMNKAEPLPVIPGAVPSPAAWPPGCRFAPRCPHAFERCAQPPPMFATGPGQQAACWLRESPAAVTAPVRQAQPRQAQPRQAQPRQAQP
jgi:oligopeptide/dipeptide ABC transporter ATP-binding protein